MTVYTWLVVLLLIAAFIFKGNRKHSYKFIIVAFILLFAVMGLRDVNAVGNDTSGTFGSYPGIYIRWGNTEWGEIFGKGENNYNIGFNYLLKLIFVLTKGNYQLLITLISLFVMLSYMRFIWKYSPSPIQSVLVFLGLLYYTMLFDVLKQAIAMAVLLFAFDAIIKKQPVRFIIAVAIASLFHFPAIVFLPAYWIGHMKVGRGYIILLAVLLLITYVFRNQLLKLMLNAYAEGENTATMEGVKFLRNKVIIMIAFVVFAVLLRPPTVDDTMYNALLMFSGIAVVFQTFCGYSNTFERLADYYFHTSIIFIPLIFERGERPGKRPGAIQNEQILRYAMILICVFAVWRFLSSVNNSAFYMPYRFLWQ